jgi:hypothetical protein
LSESNDDKEAVGGTAMGMLRVIYKLGDDSLQWNEQNALAGNSLASPSIRESKHIFAQGHDYISSPRGQAGQMILVQQVVGE